MLSFKLRDVLSSSSLNTPMAERDLARGFYGFPRTNGSTWAFKNNMFVAKSLFYELAVSLT